MAVTIMLKPKHSAEFCDYMAKGHLLATISITNDILESKREMVERYSDMKKFLEETVKIPPPAYLRQIKHPGEKGPPPPVEPHKTAENFTYW